MRIAPTLVALGILAAPGSDRPTPRAAADVDWTGPTGSGKPFLTRTPSGDLLLSWLEPRAEKRSALRVARRDRRGWSEPVTVIESDQLFVNWADFPSAVETASGAWVAHWLEKTAAKPYAYHVRVSRSTDRGRTWSPPATIHTDRTPTEHGFAAMVPRADGSVTVAWLDGRAMVDSAGAMSARSATIAADGTIGAESVLDPRTCECCQVAMAEARSGLVAVFRDRSEEEVRDIVAVRHRDGRWQAPRRVAEDNWVWRACPVNGPAIAAQGDEVAVAWFTAAGGKPRVKTAFSRDGAESFGAPMVADEGNPLGRVHLQLTGPGRGVLVWLEAKGDGAEWRLRTVAADGKVGAPATVGVTSRTRDAGFPRTAVADGQLFVAWTEPGAAPGTPGRVRVSRRAVPR